MNTNKYFSDLYMQAENAVTEFRKACDFGDSDAIDLELLNAARYELCTLRSYVQTAINEIELQTEKFYKE